MIYSFKRIIGLDVASTSGPIKTAGDILLITSQTEYNIVKKNYDIPENYNDAIWKRYICNNIGIYVFKPRIKESKRFLNGVDVAEEDEKVISGVGRNGKSYKLAIKTVYEIEKEDIDVINLLVKEVEESNKVIVKDTGFLEDIQIETMANLCLAQGDEELKGAKTLLSKDRKMILKSFSIDEYSGRFHSALTAFDSEARKRIRYKDRKMVEIDIVSSQPTILNILFKKKVESLNIDSRVSRSIDEGSFYELIMDVAGVDRKTAKLSVMWLLFSQWKNSQILDGLGSSEYKDQQEVIRKFLEWMKCEDRFFYQFIDNMKSDANYPLPKRLQMMEVDLIKHMLKSIKDAGYTEGIYTVHDCIGCPEDVSESILDIMKQSSLNYLKCIINFKIEKNV